MPVPAFHFIGHPSLLDELVQALNVRGVGLLEDGRRSFRASLGAAHRQPVHLHGAERNSTILRVAHVDCLAAQSLHLDPMNFTSYLTLQVLEAHAHFACFEVDILMPNPKERVDPLLRKSGRRSDDPCVVVMLISDRRKRDPQEL